METLEVGPQMTRLKTVLLTVLPTEPQYYMKPVGQGSIPCVAFE